MDLRDIFWIFWLGQLGLDEPSVPEHLKIKNFVYLERCSGYFWELVPKPERVPARSTTDHSPALNNNF